MSNVSDGKGGNRNRRNTQGKGANDGGKGRKGGDQAKAEPIKITEDQFKARIRANFKRYMLQSAPSEEEKKDDVNVFQTIKELLQNGQVETAEGET